MDEQKQAELIKVTRNRIEIARKHLNEKTIQESLRTMSSLEAEIPGFEEKKMKFGQFVNKEFVLLMTDIRNSTRIINEPNGVSAMFQIFYAYSAMVANIVAAHDGTATEFLGDGVLCLFDTEHGREVALRRSISAARDILRARREILNPVLLEFQLPEINYGIGIDHGMTIVTRFGFKGDNDLKAFGKCAYNVSRLCKGMNEIKVSTESKQVWPQSPTGTLIFEASADRDGKMAYRVSS